LIEHMNSHPNKSTFNLLFQNCADFARKVVNFYFPKALGRSWMADGGISTPKHAARSLVRYSKKHPDLEISRFTIPQIPGGKRSTRTRGIAESLVWSKKYIAPLLLVQPWIAASAAVAYLVSGRLDAGPSRVECATDALAACFAGDGAVTAEKESQPTISQSGGG
jgi:hypothetical protein